MLLPVNNVFFLRSPTPERCSASKTFISGFSSFQLTSVVGPAIFGDGIVHASLAMHHCHRRRSRFFWKRALFRILQKLSGDVHTQDATNLRLGFPLGYSSLLPMSAFPTFSLSPRKTPACPALRKCHKYRFMTIPRSPPAQQKLPSPLLWVIPRAEKCALNAN